VAASEGGERDGRGLHKTASLAPSISFQFLVKPKPNAISSSIVLFHTKTRATTDNNTGSFIPIFNIASQDFLVHSGQDYPPTQFNKQKEHANKNNTTSFKMVQTRYRTNS
jgi:glutathionyl-hydroquinone reductase